MKFIMTAVIFWSGPLVLFGVYLIISGRRFDRDFLDPELKYRLEGELIAFRKHSGGGEYTNFIDLQENGPRSNPLVKICVNGKVTTIELSRTVELSKEDIGKMIPLISVGSKKIKSGTLFIDNAEHRAQLNRLEERCRKMKISRLGIGIIVFGIVSGLALGIMLSH